MKPEHLTLAVLHEYAPVLSLHSIFTLAKLQPSSMRSRMRRGRPELKREESVAIIDVLEQYGVYLTLGRWANATTASRKGGSDE